MKQRRTLFSPIVVSLVVAVLGGLLASGTSAVAQTATATSATSTTTTTTSAGDVVNATVIPLSGIVNGGPGQEDVSISGNAVITCTAVKDPDFKGPTSMRHNIDLTGVTGVGQKSGTLYVVDGNVDIKIRPLAASDTIQITFPLFTVSGGMFTARTGLATFTVTTGPSGKVTGLTAIVGTPAF